MPLSSHLRLLAPCAVVGLLSFNCGEKPDPHAHLPTHTLAFGGDVIFGRNLNTALHNPKAAPNVFRSITPILSSADIALVNGEGVISQGGTFTDKGEPRPYMYRGHPKTIDLLVDAGIDVVAVGNNHSGDFGPHAFKEMLDRLLTAGMDYTGGGSSVADAQIPAYQTVGDTTIAFVGADLTIAQKAHVTASQPGILHWPGMRSKFKPKVIQGLTRLLKEAKKHAHLVVLTPHWGDNFKSEPTKLTKSLAKALIAAGYDGILGHSAHLLQGMEVIDGKPVIYDAGNLITDYGGTDGGHRSLVFELEFNQAGFTKVEAHPLLLKRNATHLATKKWAADTMDGWVKQSEALGTSVERGPKSLTVQLQPGDIRTPAESLGTPRAKPESIELAESDIVLDALPETATPVDVKWESGVRMVGYELLMTELSVPKSAQLATVYFTVDEKVEADHLIRIEAHSTRDVEKPYVRVERHEPGLGLLPVSQWEPGKIIADRNLIRLMGTPEGEMVFYAGLGAREPKVITEPVQSSVPLERGLVKLGSAVYKEGARTVFDIILGRPSKADRIAAALKAKEEAAAQEEAAEEDNEEAAQSEKPTDEAPLQPTQPLPAQTVSAPTPEDG